MRISPVYANCYLKQYLIYNLPNHLVYTEMANRFKCFKICLIRPIKNSVNVEANVFVCVYFSWISWVYEIYNYLVIWPFSVVWLFIKYAVDWCYTSISMLKWSEFNAYSMTDNTEWRIVILWYGWKIVYQMGQLCNRDKYCRRNSIACSYTVPFWYNDTIFATIQYPARDYTEVRYTIYLLELTTSQVITWLKNN